MAPELQNVRSGGGFAQRFTDVDWCALLPNLPKVGLAVCLQSAITRSRVWLEPKPCVTTGAS